MDQPDLESSMHRAALDGLWRINIASRSADILWPPIRDLARRRQLNSLRVLDIASGGGDLPIKLWRKGRAAGIDLDVVGWDISPVAIDYAQNAAQRAGAAVRFVQGDALSDPITEKFDVITSSLFLHHLDHADAVRLISVMSAAAKRLMLVNDLRRSRYGYVLAHLACRIFSRSPVVHVDGPRSVQGAFSMPEARALCQEASLSGFTIRRRWPARYLIQWTPDANEV